MSPSYILLLILCIFLLQFPILAHSACPENVYTSPSISFPQALEDVCEGGTVWVTSTTPSLHDCDLSIDKSMNIVAYDSNPEVSCVGGSVWLSFKTGAAGLSVTISDLKFASSTSVSLIELDNTTSAVGFTTDFTFFNCTFTEYPYKFIQTPMYSGSETLNLSFDDCSVASDSHFEFAPKGGYQFYVKMEGTSFYVNNNSSGLMFNGAWLDILPTLTLINSVFLGNASVIENTSSSNDDDDIATSLSNSTIRCGGCASFLNIDTVYMNNTQFLRCVSRDYGGATYLDSVGSLIAYGNTFEDNYVVKVDNILSVDVFGGALCVRHLSSTLILEENHFSRNSMHVQGDGYVEVMKGGAVYVEGLKGVSLEIEMIKNHFEQNKIVGNAGARGNSSDFSSGRTGAEVSGGGLSLQIQSNCNLHTVQNKFMSNVILAGKGGDGFSAKIGGPGGVGGNAIGGAVHIFDESDGGGEIILEGDVFESNVAIAGDGGQGGDAFDQVGGRGASAGSARGGALHISHYARVSMDGLEFNSNSVIGSISGNGGKSERDVGGAGGSSIPGFDSAGGALCCAVSTAFNERKALISNCIFVGNSVEGSQGGKAGDSHYGFLNGGDGGLAKGGGAYLIENSFSMINNTFDSNRAIAGSGGNAFDGYTSSFTNDAANGGRGSDGVGGGVCLETLVQYTWRKTYEFIWNNFSSNAIEGGDGGTGGTMINSNSRKCGNGGSGGAAHGGGFGIISKNFVMTSRGNVFLDNSAFAGRGGKGGKGTYPGSGGSGGTGGGGALSISIGQSMSTKISMIEEVIQDCKSSGGEGGFSGESYPVSSLLLLHDVADGASGGGGLGAGFCIMSETDSLNVDVEIANSQFLENSAIGGDGSDGRMIESQSLGGSGGKAMGGALHLDIGGSNSSFSATEVEFSHNHCTGGNGGSGGSSLFSSVSAGGVGGAAIGGLSAMMKSHSSPIWLRNCHIRSNFARGGIGGDGSPAGIGADGGDAGGSGAYLETNSVKSDITVHNCTFSGCVLNLNNGSKGGDSMGLHQGGNGGQMWGAGGFFVSDNSVVVFSENTVSSTLAYAGLAGFGYEYGQPSRIIGGAICIISDHQLVEYNNISDTFVHEGLAFGGGIALSPFSGDAQLILRHNTFRSCCVDSSFATFGGAAFVGSEYFFPNSSAILKNNTFTSIRMKGDHSYGAGISVSNIAFELNGGYFTDNEITGDLCLGGGFAYHVTGQTSNIGHHEIYGSVKNTAFSNSRLTGFAAAAAGLAILSVKSRTRSAQILTSNIEISNVVFANNSVTGDGAGMSLEPGTEGLSLDIHDITATGNVANGNGGFASLIADGSIDFHDCSILSNSADGYGGHLVFGPVQGKMTNNEFNGGEAGFAGGAVHMRLKTEHANVLSSSNRYVGNIASRGGALFVEIDGVPLDPLTPVSAHMLFEDEYCANNTAFSSEGSIYADLQYAYAIMNNCTFLDSSAPENEVGRFDCYDSSNITIENSFVNCEVSINSDGSQIAFYFDSSSFVMEQNILTCPIGHLYTVDNSSIVESTFLTLSCVLCRGGRYPSGEYILDVTGLDTDGDNDDFRCLQCPKEASCNGGANVTALPGHYLVDSRKEFDWGVEQSMKSSRVCPEGHCCDSVLTCTYQKCAVDDDNKNEKRAGILCGECAENYCYSLHDDCVECSKCGQTSSLAAFSLSNFFFVPLTVLFRILLPGQSGHMKIFDSFFQTLPIVGLTTRSLLEDMGNARKIVQEGFNLIPFLTNLQFVKSFGGPSCPFKNVGLGLLFFFDVISPLQYFFVFFQILFVHFVLSLRIDLLIWVVRSVIGFPSYFTSRNHQLGVNSYLRNVWSDNENDDDSDNHGLQLLPTVSDSVGEEEEEEEGDNEDDKSEQYRYDEASFPLIVDVTENQPVESGGAIELQERNEELRSQQSFIQSGDKNVDDDAEFEFRESAGQLKPDGEKTASAVAFPFKFKFWNWHFRHSRRYTFVFLTLMLESYRTVLSVCLKYLQCHKVPVNGEEKRLLYWFTAHECYTWWQIILWIVFVFLLVPSPLYIFLYRYFLRIMYVNRSMGVKQKASLDMYEEAFRNHAKYWESVLYGRRLILLVVFYFVRNMFVRNVLVAVFSSTFLLTHLIVVPFKHFRTNVVEGFSLLFLLILSMLKIAVGLLEEVGQEEMQSLSNAMIWCEAIFIVLICIAVGWLATLRFVEYCYVGGRKTIKRVQRCKPLR